jgi:prephenate dehydrogenase
MKLFRRVTILGIGLIGGSLALAIKKHRLADTVVGISRRRQTLALARRAGVIDRGSLDLSAARGSDLVIVATPVDTMLSLARQLSAVIGSECMVTDVGSTKRCVVARYETFFSNYLGSHPLAGSEKKGVRFASGVLFAQSLCIITPTAKTKGRVVTKMTKLWRSIGAHIVSMSPERHDRVVAFVSHLPHAAAFSLASSVPKEYLPYGATGLRDTTRIVASDTKLWSSIFLSNPDNITKAITLFQQHLRRLKESIRRGDRRRLQIFLHNAQIKRQELA